MLEGDGVTSLLDALDGGTAKDMLGKLAGTGDLDRALAQLDTNELAAVLAKVVTPVTPAVPLAAPVTAFAGAVADGTGLIPGLAGIPGPIGDETEPTGDETDATGSSGGSSDGIVDDFDLITAGMDRPGSAASEADGPIAFNGLDSTAFADRPGFEPLVPGDAGTPTSPLGEDVENTPKMPDEIAPADGGDREVFKQVTEPNFEVTYEAPPVEEYQDTYQEPASDFAEGVDTADATEQGLDDAFGPTE